MQSKVLHPPSNVTAWPRLWLRQSPAVKSLAELGQSPPWTLNQGLAEEQAQALEVSFFCQKPRLMKESEGLKCFLC
jgi:hypothetical protein